MTINGRRLPIVLALEHLDEEAFTYLVPTLQQIGKERGGFGDQIGLARLETACDVYLKGLQTPTPDQKAP